MIKLKSNYTYAVACPTSMGVRITPENRMAVHNSNHFIMQATSAETNVLNVSSSLGKECLAITRFVEGSPVAAFIKSQLRARGISYAGPDVPQGGPWGARHQFNIADSGFGLRAARVWNDRAGEVGCGMDASEYDLDDIFNKKGVAILHISGLIAALSKETTKACLEIARYAKKSGTTISFDLNYRASFWKGREEELSAAFKEIAGLSDILIGNEEDFQLCLSLPGPESGGKDLSEKIDGFKQMITLAQKEYPGVSVFANTLREVVSANLNLWGALLYADGSWYQELPREIDILDRIGGGDGFTGGLLYGVLSGWEPEKWLQFGWACGAMAAGSLNDYAEPADESQVWAMYAGNARVQR